MLLLPPVLGDLERVISFVLNGGLDLLISLSTLSFWTSSKDIFISELTLLTAIAAVSQHWEQGKPGVVFYFLQDTCTTGRSDKAFTWLVLCPRDVPKTPTPQILLNPWDTQLKCGLSHYIWTRQEFLISEWLKYTTVARDREEQFYRQWVGTAAWESSADSITEETWLHSGNRSLIQSAPFCEQAFYL